MFIGLVLSELIISLLLGLYVFFYIGRIIRIFGGDSKKRSSMILRATITLLSVVGVCMMLTVAGIAVLHIILLCMLLELIGVILTSIKFIKQNSVATKIINLIFRTAIGSVLITAILFTYGYFNMSNVVLTQYTIQTDKTASDYRIALITDTHYGTIQDKSVLQKAVSDVSDMHPDIVILGGDIVEENTSRNDMIDAFRTLSQISSTYGTYYVYGNHDMQNYTTSKFYDTDELEQTITSCGINILCDECITINNELELVGRKDRSITPVRKDISDLMTENNNKYTVVIDHQPTDVDNVSSAKADLMLSGHTHAGQMIPIGLFIDIFGGYSYGEYTIGDMPLIVSSGLTGWGYPIRTSGNCEYVIIDIQSK